MKLYHFVGIALVALGLSACKSDLDSIPDSFPKTHLIEEFTGQGCGHCPRGMDSVHAFMEKNPNYILVLHHTYGTDNFTVSGSQKIAKQLNVSAAPQACIDRTKTKSADGNKIIFNPISALHNFDTEQLASTTYASVNIANEYDPETRLLQVTVSGEICTKDYPQLKLTVLVKESGMIAAQADFYHTENGWKEFRHANAVRAVLSDPTGDIVKVNKQRYSDTFAFQMSKKWNLDNCSVVAFLTEDFKPVVQAAEKPVIEGTKGGADILHEGITPY